jgi:hypothetical protein
MMRPSESSGTIEVESGRNYEEEPRQRDSKEYTVRYVTKTSETWTKR